MLVVKQVVKVVFVLAYSRMNWSFSDFLVISAESHFYITCDRSRLLIDISNSRNNLQEIPDVTNPNWWTIAWL